MANWERKRKVLEEFSEEELLKYLKEKKPVKESSLKIEFNELLENGNLKQNN